LAKAPIKYSIEIMSDERINISDIRDQLSQSLSEKNLQTEGDQEPLLAIVKDKMIQDVPQMYEDMSELSGNCELAAFGRDH
jgi:hypothetical protein